METLEKKYLKILESAFNLSKRGKIISAIELAVLMGAPIAILVIYSNRLPVSSFINNIGIILIVLASTVGIITGYKMGSFFSWRFFKPNKDDIKIYVQEEIRKLMNNIQDRGRLIERKKGDLNNLIKEASENDQKDLNSIHELTEKFLK